MIAIREIPKRAWLAAQDTIPFELWRGLDFYYNLGRSRLLQKAVAASFFRNIILLLAVLYFSRYLPEHIYGLVFVALGASLLGYVTLRMRIHALDFAESHGERFASSSNRQSYFDVINLTDSIFGFLYIVAGFSIRISQPIF